MRSLAISACVLIAGCAVNETPDATGAAAVVDPLPGEVLGPPRNCLRLGDVVGQQAITDSIILWETRGDEFYRMDLDNRCPHLDNLVMRHETTQANLCSGDITTLFHPSTGATFGSCVLTEFVPFDPAEGG